MATDVVMPQMGESIAEGTVTKWLKKVGDKIERDEPLLEISTDKVDTVIPSPQAGTLTEIRAQEGETVEVQSVIAVLDGPQGGAAKGDSDGARPEEAKSEADGKKSEDGRKAESTSASEPAKTDAPSKSSPPSAPAPAPASQPVAASATATTAPSATPAPTGNGQALSPTHPESGKVLTSPLVKRIARTEGVDLKQVPGTGMGGRVTRKDILSFIEKGGAGVAPAPGVSPLAPAEATTAGLLLGEGAPNPAWAAQVMEGDRVEKMSNMRRLIAEHMVYSKRVTPHVYTMFEFDMTNIVNLRKREKASFEEKAGTKLTYMPFVAKAVVHALQENPLVNASVHGDQVVHHKHVNLGIAVALEKGLIVPVVKKAEELSFVGLARAMNDIAERARNKQLTPDDVTGGTFTITNPGVFGSLIGFAVINQPQVGILDMGAIVKRPVVVETDGEDSIAIRSMQLMSISYDHRIVDGATADHFMNAVRDYLQEWNQPLV